MVSPTIWDSSFFVIFPTIFSHINYGHHPHHPTGPTSQHTRKSLSARAPLPVASSNIHGTTMLLANIPGEVVVSLWGSKFGGVNFVASNWGKTWFLCVAHVANLCKNWGETGKKSRKKTSWKTKESKISDKISSSFHLAETFPSFTSW